MNTPQKPVRAYKVKDAIMIIAGATITESAITNQKELELADTTFSAKYLQDLRGRFDNAARTILGADNASALRNSTTILKEAHDTALTDLRHTKTLIENRYDADPARRDELLNLLGLKTYYADAARGKQDAMGHLLSRFSQNINNVSGELTAKGLPPARIKALNT